MNTNTSVTIPSTIPADIVEGGYYLYVVADQDDLILERDEDNNQQSRSGQFTVGNAETACASQNDAGMGGDAGNDTMGALDLGNYADAEYRWHLRVQHRLHHRRRHRPHLRRRRAVERRAADVQGR